MVLTVPMRNGNSMWNVTNEKVFLVLTVPMRNGNVSPVALFTTMRLVLTVPMRNGNDIEGFDSVMGLVGSYRTYEEWKQITTKAVNDTYYVLTVPMRNGNLKNVDNFFKFLAVLTVPMRNGNAAQL